MKILLLEDVFTLFKEIAVFFASKEFECVPYCDEVFLLKNIFSYKYD